LDAQRELAEEEHIDKMRFGILKLLTLHSIKIEDKDHQVPKEKTKKKRKKSLK
jgi:hypothetical protein